MDIHPCEACGHGTYVSEKVYRNILCIDCHILNIAYLEEYKCLEKFPLLRKDPDLFSIKWVSKQDKLVQIYFSTREIYILDTMPHLKFSKLLDAVKQAMRSVYRHAIKTS